MMKTYKTLLTKKQQLNSNTYLFHFDLIDPKEIDFKPGQYVMLKVPSAKGPVSRLYSIASSSAIKNSFELIVEIVPGGLASNYFLNLKEKNEVIFEGPAGMFGLKENDKTQVFLVTGTGIAPIFSMIKSNFQFSISNFHLFWGMKFYKDIYLFNELKQFNNLTICLSQEKNLDMIPEEDKKYFKLGHVDSNFEEQFINSEFYLCGGRVVVESLKFFLLSKNISRENIMFEKF